MKLYKGIRLMITPQTHVRVTQKDSWLLGVTEQYLIDHQDRYPNAMARRLRILKYFEYKDELKRMASGYQLPEAGMWIRFYLPVFASWSGSKQRAFEFKPHQKKPDADNLTKALFDALLKEDKQIWDYRVSKFWYNSKFGFIDIIEGEAPTSAFPVNFESRQDILL